MKRLVSILFLFIVPIFLSAASNENFVKVRYPSFVPMNADISYSYIFTPRKMSVDSVMVQIIPGERISISDIMLNFEQSKSAIDFKTVTDPSQWNDIYQFTLNDSVLFKQKAFQIVVNLENINNEDLVLNTRVTCYYHGNKIKVYTTDTDEFSSNFIEPVIIIPYHVQTVAGQSITFPPGAGFILDEETLKFENNLMIEFWAKFNNYNGDFFRLFSREKEDVYFTIGLNEYNLLKIPGYAEPGELEDFYISDNAWYHFNIVLRKNEAVADLYVNDNLVYSVILNSLAIDELLGVELSNSGMEKSDFVLELMKVWDFNNSLENSFINKNYRSYFQDSSRVIADFTFDRVLEDDRLFKHQKFQQNYRLSISDAPIFSKAPELNVSSMSTFFNIEWYNRDPKTALGFYLEKSVDGINYNSIYSVDALDDPGKIYYYSDSKSPEDELVYYRVRQENSDGTFVYSSQVKIGQGNVELFSINQNYPNPFNPVTTITIDMFESAEVDITVYDIMGKKIEKLHTGNLGEGIHTFTFDGSELPSGIYLYEVKSIYSTVVQKMILTK